MTRHPVRLSPAAISGATALPTKRAAGGVLDSQSPELGIQGRPQESPGVEPDTRLLTVRIRGPRGRYGGSSHRQEGWATWVEVPSDAAGDSSSDLP